jgi:hypothetical protein
MCVNLDDSREVNWCHLNNLHALFQVGADGGSTKHNERQLELNKC